MTRQLDQALAGALVFGAMTCASASAAEPELVWELDGLKQPESAVFDAEREVVYVSNVDGGPMDHDGKGQIAKVSPEGSMIEADWITGLDAPKGMALHGDMLYVADIDRLVAIDVAAGKIIERHHAPDAQLLNDVTADAEGRIYVSDWMDNTIYRLAAGDFQVWLRDAALEQPNGLLAEEDRIVVGAWGVMTDGFATKTPGHLKAVGLETKAVSSLGDGDPVGNLDGVEADGEGNYLVTDWMAGGLLRIDPSSGAEQLLDLEQGSADLEYIVDQQLAIIPMMNNDKLVAYRIE